MSLAALRLRPFRHLLAAYGVNQLGDWAGEVALAVAVFAMTASPLAVAATWLVHRCVAALGAPPLIARLERLHPGRLLPRLCLMQAAIFVALASAVATHAGLAVLLGLLAVDGVLAPTGRALTRTSVVAVTRSAGLLYDGNALINVVFTANGVLAPALGGLLVAMLGPASALLADAASFALAAGALATAAVPRPGGGREPRGRALARLRSSVRYVRSQPMLWGLFGADAALTALLAMILPIEVVFVTETLGADETAFGCVLTAWGAGMIVGAFLLARLRRVSLGRLLIGAAAGEAIGTLVMGASHGVGMVIIGSLIGGIGNGIYGMAFVTAFQERTSDAYQARVNGLWDTVMSVSPGIGFAAGGALSTLAEPRAVYLVSGAGCLAVTAFSSARFGGAQPSERAALRTFE